MATWSLALGILSFLVIPFVGAIAAIITGARAKRAMAAAGGAKAGRRAAVAGQVLGAINIVVSVVGAALILVLVVLVSHRVSYTKLAIGDCFNRDPGPTFSAQVTRVDCRQPHVWEVFGSYDEPSTGGWPGDRGFVATASDRCDPLAQRYITGSRNRLSLTYIYPLRSSWDAGFRKVICAVANSGDSKRTGSVRGAGPPTTAKQ